MYNSFNFEISELKSLLFEGLVTVLASVSVFSGLFICLLWIGITGVGCQTDGLDVNRGIRAFNSGKKAVDSIRLFTSTALFNLDGESHSNGFSARVFAVHNSIPKPIQIVEGTLEIIIYDTSFKKC